METKQETITFRENIPFDNTFIVIETRKGEIISLKRPADGAIFSIGDWVDAKNGWNGFEKRFRHQICWFSVRQERLCIGLTNDKGKCGNRDMDNGFCLLSQLRHIELTPAENAAKEMIELFWDKSKSTPEDCGLIGARHNAIKCCNKIISHLKDENVINHYKEVILEIGKW